MMKALLRWRAFALLRGPGGGRWLVGIVWGGIDGDGRGFMGGLRRERAFGSCGPEDLCIEELSSAN